ncbi:MAG: DUF4886 domain-containing protein [Muribaculaceae bacterium]|nr:DUF4886 domain-containing protein [Muribaculaceae bacterium]
MKLNLKNVLWMVVLPILLATGCSEEEKYVGLRVPSAQASNKVCRDSLPIYRRHKDAPLKILAIGNSFTNCATANLPRFIKYINGDSLCFAKLVLSGSSLSMHWANHRDNVSCYEMTYADDGGFVDTDIKTIDEALAVMDWDIIVVQQVSGLSGDYSSYQPYLSFLCTLFVESNPDVMTAWHSTWAYMPGTEHPDFYRYGYDPEAMYAAIQGATQRACTDSDIDLMIPSGTLIKRLREAFPDVEDGFAPDGYHIDMSNMAAYALSALWYEVLVHPFTGTSSLESPLLLANVGPENIDRVEEIINTLIENP